MRSLRLRIAAILIGAIVTVVLIATFAVMLVTSQPDPARMIRPVAGQIEAISRFAGQNGQDAGKPSFESPHNLGRERNDLTEALQERLVQEGIGARAAVYDLAGRDDQIAIVELGEERFGIEFPTNLPPPPEIWIVLGAWLGLVVAGVFAVSLFIAYRVTQPFAILEEAVGAVGADGVLPHIPEQGSGEARQTAEVLNRLSQRLRSAMESRMRLVAAAGHDLRTPMTRMRIRAEFLNDEDRQAWSRDIDELERIADSAIRLVKEETNRDERAPIALDGLVRETVDELSAHGYGVAVGHLDPVTMTLPRMAMQRALRNLLINAATHGRGGTVRLAVSASEALLTIEDEGPGIPPDLLDRVFEPFFRAEPGRIQTVPGAGLGLAIAREIINRAGGTLSVMNRTPRGLTQVVSLPRGR